MKMSIYNYCSKYVICGLLAYVAFYDAPSWCKSLTSVLVWMLNTSVSIGFLVTAFLVLCVMCFQFITLSQKDKNKWKGARDHLNLSSFKVAERFIVMVLIGTLLEVAGYHKSSMFYIITSIISWGGLLFIKGNLDALLKTELSDESSKKKEITED